MKAVNKDAYYNYEVLAEYEAGVVLSGAETKSAKTGAVSMKGARAVLRDQELFLVGMQINPYRFAPTDAFEPTRSRKLLLNHREIEEIRGKLTQKGLTLIPLECYNKGNWIKIKLGLVRGKKTFEKRELIKKRTEERTIQERLKNASRR